MCSQVRCEKGRRVYAQYGEQRDALWFPGTIAAVHRNDIGQWVDVHYDDGAHLARTCPARCFGLVVGWGGVWSVRAPQSRSCACSPTGEDEKMKPIKRVRAMEESSESASDVNWPPKQRVCVVVGCVVVMAVSWLLWSGCGREYGDDGCRNGGHVRVCRCDCVCWICQIVLVGRSVERATIQTGRIISQR